MAEDAEAAGEELAAFAVAFDVLVGQEPNRRLGDGESHGRFGVRSSWPLGAVETTVTLLC